MPTNKTRPRPKVVRSKALALKTGETLLQGYKDLTSDSRNWMSRAENATVGSAKKLFKAFERERQKVEKLYVRAQRVVGLPVPTARLRIDWGKIRDVIRPACQTFKGVTETRFSVVGSALDLPDDGDTDWGYEATSFTPASNAYHSLMFKDWVNDQTHWYAFDAIEMMWVISHFGFEFPAPQCPGTISYEANVSLNVSASVLAETGLVNVELLSEEVPDAAAVSTPPATFEAYGRSHGALNFTSSGYKYLPAPISGSFHVGAGKRSRVWFGASVICSALDGFAGTNGYSYLVVGKPDGETVPGVKYAFEPD